MEWPGDEEKWIGYLHVHEKSNVKFMSIMRLSQHGTCTCTSACG